MSSTTKITDTADRARDAFARSGLSPLAHKSADNSREAAQTIAETADKVTDASSKMAEQGRAALLTGVRAAADVGGRVADIGLGRGRDALSSAIHMMDIYRDASEQTAAGMQALFSSWMAMGRGVQQMQQAWLSVFDQAAGSAGRKPQDLLRCKTMVEVAEVQRDLYIDAMKHALESNNRLMDAVSQTAKAATAPLQSHRS